MASTFEIEIGQVTQDSSYPLQVVSSAAGESQGRLSLVPEILLARRNQLQQAVLASSVSSRRLVPSVEQPVRETGQELFDALFASPGVLGRFRASKALADERGEPLRIVLRIAAPELATLPWEAMYDAEVGAYVCRREPLVRFVPVPAAAPVLQVKLPLRILGVAASPRGLPALNVDREMENLRQALAGPISRGWVKLTWVDDATWPNLQDALLSDEVHVLHFIGHGDFDPDQDSGVIALVGTDGRVDRVNADRLLDLLHEARPMPRLLVLNSCSGGTSGATDLFSGTAAALVRGGIAAVAAMQFEVSDGAAIAFARGFYTALANERGVDEAVGSGRVGILGTGDGTLEWVTPVLYLRGSDAHLFAFDDRRESPPVQSQDIPGGPAGTGVQSGVTTPAGRRLPHISPGQAPSAANVQPPIRRSRRPPVEVLLLSAADVSSAGFTRTTYRRGYDPKEVDDFLGKVTTAISMRSDAVERRAAGELISASNFPLSPSEVKNKNFTPTRLREGYAEDEVDDFLARVMETLRELDRRLES